MVPYTVDSECKHTHTHIVRIKGLNSSQNVIQQHLWFRGLDDMGLDDIQALTPPCYFIYIYIPPRYYVTTKSH